MSFLKNPTSAINCNEMAYIEEYFIVFGSVDYLLRF